MEPGQNRTDAEILSAFLDGSGPATSVVRRWVEPVVRYEGWRFDDPESIVQDVLVRLLTALRAGRLRKAQSFRVFARAVAKHACLDAYRSLRSRRRTESGNPEGLEPASGAGNPERAHLAREELEILRYIYQQLSDECRRLWALVYREERSTREIGRELGISEGNVRVRVHRCLSRARHLAGGFMTGPAA